jgi:hypothetical protein
MRNEKRPRRRGGPGWRFSWLFNVAAICLQIATRSIFSLAVYPDERMEARGPQVVGQSVSQWVDPLPSRNDSAVRRYRRAVTYRQRGNLPDAICADRPVIRIVLCHVHCASAHESSVRSQLSPTGGQIIGWQERLRSSIAPDRSRSSFDAVPGGFSSNTRKPGSYRRPGQSCWIQ